MKRGLLTAGLLTLCLGMASAQLQFRGGVHGGIDFGSFPKPVDQIYGTGFGFGGDGGLLFMKYVGLRLSVDYRKFSSDKSKLADLYATTFTYGGVPANPALTTVDGLNTTDISFTLSGIGRLPTGSVATPYALAGLGMHILSISDGNISYQGTDITQQLINLGILGKSSSSTKFGIQFGAGSELKLGLLSLFLEVKYVLVFTPDNSTSYVPIELGVIL